MQHLRKLFGGWALSLFVAGYIQAGELGGMLKSEAAYSYLDHQWQKQAVELELEWNQAVFEGELTLITRMLLDGEDLLNPADKPDTYAQGRSPRHDARHGSAALRELYWEAAQGDTYWRLGKQQVVWGEADGLKLLDVINPQSYREFILDDFDDSRIPLWMVNAEHTLPDDSVLQVLWIPDSTTHDLAPRHSPFRLSSPLLVPQGSAASGVRFESPSAPARVLRDSDFALRLARFWQGWDYTLNYLYHTVDEPIFRTVTTADGPVVQADFSRSHLLGASASTAIEDWIVRLEFAYETNRYHRSRQSPNGVVKANQWGSVLGLDYQGWRDQLVSLQWFHSRILGHTDRIVKDPREQVMTLIWEWRFMNDTLTLRTSKLYSLNRHDSLMRARLSYNLVSSVDVYAGVDRFYGTQTGVFGQFDQADRVVTGVEWGF